jgi:hypothetical protein
MSYKPVPRIVPKEPELKGWRIPLPAEARKGIRL